MPGLIGITDDGARAGRIAAMSMHTDTRPASDSGLRHLMPGWYAVVMGLCGLALAWHRTTDVLGPTSHAVASGIFWLAVGVFVALAVATLARGLLHADAWAEDRRHPVRHTFIAALPIAVILLATVGVAVLGTTAWLDALWWAGCVSQLWVTWWVLSRWWRSSTAAPQAGLSWATATPALFIPIVGNVLAPLAGVPLGHVEWSAAQFGIGLLFWPVVLVLLVTRLAVQGMWPDRLLPTTFIVLAPPAVVGSSLLQLGAPLAAVWAVWGMALFSFLWVMSLAARIAALPFALPHWGMSFPLAAFAALTLRLGAPLPWVHWFGLALLAVSTILIAILFAATLQGLARGTLLVPEPGAPPAKTP